MKPSFRHLAIVSGLALGLLPLSSALHATGRPGADAAKPLRVCADGNYMPYSNRARQGFENKVAALIAKAMGRKLEYHWASYRGQGGFSNFLADNLDVGKCDAIMNLPYGDPMESYTQPYYSSSYVFVTKKSAPYDITSMNSPALRKLKIGIEKGTPPQMALKVLSLTKNIVPFDIAGSRQSSPKAMLQAVQDGKVGVLITWKPVIGYYLKHYPDLKVTPVPSEQYAPGIPAERFTYFMAMGVGQHDKALKRQIDKVIATHKAQIHKILTAYNVPVRPSAHQAVNYPGQ
jgi:mxaJ protein